MDGDESLSHLAAMGLPHQNTRATAGGAVLVDDEAAGQQRAFRFTKDTPEHRLLEKVFRSGAAEASDRPSDIHSRYEMFKKINPNSFRSQHNKLKSTLGIATKAGEFVEPC